MNDDFTPFGVSQHIVFMIIGVIVVGVVIGMLLTLEYDVKMGDDNGAGLGIPMGVASEDTDTGLVFAKTEDGITINGAYNGTVAISNGVLMLANNQAVYVLDGVMHYYNGTTDRTLTEFVAVINKGAFNAISFDWLYYPDPNGLYRAYDGSVDYGTADSVAGIGAYNSSVIISMDTTPTSTNIAHTVTVTVDKEGDKINEVKYRWEV